MQRLLFIIICSLLLHSAAGGETHRCSFSMLTVTTMNNSTAIPLVKKLTLKERLIKKILEHKIKKLLNEEKTKLLVNKLGVMSFIAGIMAPLLLLVLFAIQNYAVVVALFILALALMLTAIITGIISLLKRKKLADKKGTHNIPAILGIVFGGGLLLLLILVVASFSLNYS